MTASSLMRVLQLGSSTGLYGAERWILALARSMPDSDIAMSVAVVKDEPGGEPALCAHARAAGLAAHAFESMGRMSFGAIGQLRRFIRKQSIDILHTHGYKTDLIGLLAVRGTRCKLISTPHGWDANGARRLALYEALDRIALRWFDAVVPLSTTLYADLERAGVPHDRLILIENAVDLSEVEEAPAHTDTLAALRAQGVRIIGYIGRLTSGKRLDTLIAAFAMLADRTAVLCLVGEGPERDALGSLAQQLGVAERVQFLGFRGDRLSLLKDFDAFVLPSASEGTPRCVMEAMAAGVPTFATDIPGCRLLVEHDRTGILFPVGDAAGLGRALDAVLGDPARASALGSAGQEHVRRTRSAVTMANRYADVYHRLLAQQPLQAGGLLAANSK